ncbi:hypothetical protein ACTFIU_004869 [Dictyostelium citrinum]
MLETLSKFNNWSSSRKVLGILHYKYSKHYNKDQICPTSFHFHRPHTDDSKGSVSMVLEVIKLIYHCYSNLLIFQREFCTPIDYSSSEMVMTALEIAMTRNSERLISGFDKFRTGKD